MITIYKSIDGKLTTVDRIEDNTWVNVIRPNERELQELSEETGIPIDFLADPLDIDERARIEMENGALLVVLHTPVRNEEEDMDDVPFTTLPVGVIIKDRFIVTVCLKPNDIIEHFALSRVKNFRLHDRSRFAIQLFHHTAVLFLKHLKEINRKTNQLETELHKSMRNEVLIKLLNIEKSLVYFMTSVRANEIIMTRLQRGDIIDLNEVEKDLLEDTVTENLQAIHMTKIYSNILSGMMDAFASVISNNLNVVMKFLTAVTIILQIPILIASVYGMNIELPLQHNLYAFTILGGCSIILSLFGVWIFIKKKWI
ncbi:magnesium transporter CorA family protein [Desulfovibrio inopinatus]|uniref:magnesium transporter CorA family protein n=1 Tax=Desulfovibrio inopinatus TaxID=102109 RepID=UPI0004862694|nr:magnesium transporter CorA family protein [Desulfovibrio inopinatus]